MRDREAGERDDVGSALQKRHQVGDGVGLSTDAVAEVGQAVRAEVDQVGPVVGGRDTDRISSDEFARVAARLLGRADVMTDEVKLGVTDDGPKRHRPDIAGAAVHHAVCHGLP